MNFGGGELHSLIKIFPPTNNVCMLRHPFVLVFILQGLLSWKKEFLLIKEKKTLFPLATSFSISCILKFYRSPETIFFLYQTHPWRFSLSGKSTVLIHFRDGTTQRMVWQPILKGNPFFRVAENFGVLYLMYPSLLAIFVCAHQTWWLDYLPETCHPTKAKYITSIVYYLFVHYLLMVSKQWLHQGSDTQLAVHAD